MESENADSLHYKRARFSTHLPTSYLYSPSHFWLEVREGGILRVGFTKFATRMLGELVDHGFEVQANDPVEPGKIVGWVEGFKAISDLYCIAKGTFVGTNPKLTEEIEAIGKSPYRGGWLYEIQGQPDDRCMDVHAYASLLDKTIDKILEKQKNDESSHESV